MQRHQQGTLDPWVDEDGDVEGCKDVVNQEDKAD